MTWPTQRVGRVAKTISGSGFPPEYQGRERGDLPFIKVSDLARYENVNGIIHAAHYVSYTDKTALGARIVPEGSVVFPKVGAALLGNARAITLIACLMDNNLMAIVPGEGDTRFWKYALRTVDLGELSGSGPLPYISDSQVRDLRIPFPPLGEQRRIADFLDTETARMDALQNVRDRQLRALGELAASRITAIIPDQATVPFVRLGYLAVIQSGITVDGGRKFGADSVTLPYLRVANVQDGHVDLGSVSEITVPRATARSSTLKYGDVLMTEGGDLDKLGRGTVWLDEIKNCLHQNHVFAVRPDQRKLAPEYLALMTRTSYARSYFESTGNKTTNLASTSSSKIRDFRVPLLDVTEQARVFQETDAWLKNIATVEVTLIQQRALLAERRQALITAAVTGGITV